MKPRGYSVRIETNHVTVEHRASFRPRTIAILAVLYVCYCLSPSPRNSLLKFLRAGDPVIGCFALFFLAIPLIGGVTWLTFQSGEVFRCDEKTLALGQRRTLGRWHRSTFAKAGTSLAWTFFFRSKARSYEAIQVDSGGVVIRVLEDLPKTDGCNVLNACSRLGWKVTLPEILPMNEDIEKRGWFVNPWKPT